MSIIKQIGQNIRRFRDRKVLSAVHDDDLEELLSHLGYLEQISSGEIKCTICESNIDLSNLSGWQKRGEKLRFFCESNECLLTGQVFAQEAIARD